MCEHCTCDKRQSREGQSRPLVLWDARVVGERKLAKEGGLVFAAMSGSGVCSPKMSPCENEAKGPLLTLSFVISERAEAARRPRAEFAPPNRTASSTDVIYRQIQRVPTDTRSEQMRTVGCTQAGANPA